MRENILEMHGIVKEFSHVRVLDEVNFELRAGEVHALLGANGAGKSTLMKILNGIYSLTAGGIRYNGKPVSFHTPRNAYNCGITMIHQELDLVGCRNVAENIYLGRELFRDRAQKILDRKQMYQETEKLMQMLGFQIPATAMVSTLSPAQQQLVLIARTVSCNSRVIVMDEPTSSLSHTETQQLFKVIRMLREKGISIIYISHYLEEVFEVADRLTVLRDGRTVATAETKDCTVNQLVQWMIGREAAIEKNIGEPKTDREVLLDCKGLTTARDLIHDVSLCIRKGEIVGLAGVVGSGRSEIAKMIFGAEKVGSGSICYEGKTVQITSPTKAVHMGINMVQEDRKLEGLVLKLGINTNMWLSYLGKVQRAFALNYKMLGSKVQDMIRFMSVKCTSPKQIISDLSGGNQQKVAIGKCLMNDPKLLILDQPTRGVDVGAKSEIYELVTQQAAEQGTAILYISDELDELIALCDRIYIIKQGRCVKELDNHSTDIKKSLLLQYMVD